MDAVREGEDSSITAPQPVPLSNTLLLYRVLNGLLLFCLPVITGSFFYLQADWRFLGAWVLLSHLWTFFNVSVSLRQYKLTLLRASIVIHGIWAVVSLIMAIMVGEVARRAGQMLAARIGVPIIVFVTLLHVLSLIFGIQVLREPVRGLSNSQTVEQRREGHFEFAIADTEEAEELEDLEDGLGTAATLHSTAPTPTGFSRYVPIGLQILAILQCVLWPMYFLDVIVSLMYPSDVYRLLVLLGITITYHYAMLIWIIGSTAISYRFKNKFRMKAAAWAGLAYLLFCFALALIKFAMWQRDFLSPVLTLIHIILLGAWCIGAHFVGYNTFDYSTVPVCCSP